MKIKIIIAILLLTLVSCSNDSETTQPTQQVTKCGVVTSITPIQVTTTTGVKTRYKYNLNLDNNKTGYILIDLNNYYSIGENVCRNDIVTN